MLFDGRSSSLLLLGFEQGLRHLSRPCVPTLVIATARSRLPLSGRPSLGDPAVPRLGNDDILRHEEVYADIQVLIDNKNNPSGKVGQAALAALASTVLRGT